MRGCNVKQGLTGPSRIPECALRVPGRSTKRDFNEGCDTMTIVPARGSVRHLRSAGRREVTMVDQGPRLQASRRRAIVAFVAALASAPWLTTCMTIDPAAAADATYPNWKGQWIPVIRTGVAD